MGWLTVAVLHLRLLKSELKKKSTLFQLEVSIRMNDLRVFAIAHIFFHEPAWLHQGQIVPDQSGGLLWWSGGTGAWGKGDGCHLPGLCKAVGMVPHHMLL